RKSIPPITVKATPARASPAIPTARGSHSGGSLEGFGGGGHGAGAVACVTTGPAWAASPPAGNAGACGCLAGGPGSGAGGPGAGEWAGAAPAGGATITALMHITSSRVITTRNQYSALLTSA